MKDVYPVRVQVATQFLSMLRGSRAVAVCGGKVKEFKTTPSEDLACEAAMDVMNDYFLGRLFEQKGGDKPDEPPAAGPGEPALLTPFVGGSGGAVSTSNSHEQNVEATVRRA